MSVMRFEWSCQCGGFNCTGCGVDAPSVLRPGEAGPATAPVPCDLSPTPVFSTLAVRSRELPLGWTAHRYPASASARLYLRYGDHYPKFYYLQADTGLGRRRLAPERASSTRAAGVLARRPRRRAQKHASTGRTVDGPSRSLSAAALKEILAGAVLPEHKLAAYGRAYREQYGSVPHKLPSAKELATRCRVLTGLTAPRATIWCCRCGDWACGGCGGDGPPPRGRRYVGPAPPPVHRDPPAASATAYRARRASRGHGRNSQVPRDARRSPGA